MEKIDKIFLIIFILVGILVLIFFFYSLGVISFYKKFNTLHGSLENKRQLQYMQYMQYKRKQGKDKDIKNKRNVFMFWIGKDYKLIALLRKLILQHSQNGKNYVLHFINHDNMFDYIDNENDLIPDTFFTNLIPAHQADFLRIYLLNKYGGIWMDSDTLMLNKNNNFSVMFDFLDSPIKDGFFIKEDNKYIWNGVFGSKAGTPLMKAWMDQMKKTMFGQKTIRWSEIGSEMLGNLYHTDNELFENYNMMNGLDTVYPIPWKKCVKELIQKPAHTFKNHVRDFQPFLVLVNSVYKEMEKEDDFENKLKTIPLGIFIQQSIQSLFTIQ